MRIFFSALVSMVNGTREWDADPALGTDPYEPPERRASTCDNRLDEEHDVGLPCFREFSAHGVQLTFVWKTFLRDRPTPARAQAGKWYNRTLFFSDLLLNGFLSRGPAARPARRRVGALGSLRRLPCRRAWRPAEYAAADDRRMGARAKAV